MKKKLMLLLMVMLAMTAKADVYYLYAVVDGTELTIKAARIGYTFVPKGGVLFQKENSWNSTFRDNVTTAVIDASCKNYDGSKLDYLFYRCSKLETISGLSNLNTSNVTTMEYMFYMCDSLKSIDLSNFNTSKVTSMKYMFGNCQSLTSLDVSTFNTSKVTNMSNMFLSCKGLTSLNISNFNTEKVTSMSDMFCGCRALTSLDLSHFNTSNVTTMVGMFQSCQNLTALDISTFNTEKVTSMYDMFHLCKSLTSIDVTKFNTDNVTNMSGMFEGCAELTSIDVTNFNTAKVTQMNGMFNRCSKLTSLDVTGFNTENVTSMSSMFGRCTGLKVLNLSSFNTAKVTNMTDMFYGCSSLKTIHVGDDWTVESVTSGDGMFLGCTAIGGEQDTSYNKDKADHTYARIDGLASLPGYLWGTHVLYAVVSGNVMTLKCGMVEPEAYAYNTYEGWASHFRSSVKHIIVDESCRNFKNTSLKCLFYGYYNLEDISGIENLNTENVTVINRLFENCEKLPSLDVSSLNTSKVTAMRSVFEECFKLTSLDLRTFNTSQVTDMTAMFKDCTSLKHLDIRTWNTENVTTIDDMFSHCTALTTLNLSNFNTRKVRWPWRLFSGCTNLTTIIVGPDWSTDAFYSSKEMFKDCTSLVGQDGTKVGTTIDATYAHTGTGGYLTGLTRSLTANAANDKRWTTFYTDNVGYTFDDGEEACAYTATYNGGAGTLTLHKLGTDGRNIPANTAVIVVASEGNAKVNMTVDNTLDAYDGENDLHGVDIDTPTSTILTNLGNGTFYVLGNKNAHFGFHQYEGSTMAGHKAFLLVDSGVAQSHSLTMMFDEATGITTTNYTNFTNSDDAWNSLDGRRLQGKPTKSGLYINNGKKVIIK
ncbi:MAG: BspA family leucine-rich repeat surface protein [Prevotella sp.]|nr:BspA family leucine-rich repeat surface protein [Prevotella sp.]